jgi:glutamine amidotransferase
MCRLFGMSGAPARVQATFWLLDAPDSLTAQSRRNPDGTGLGFFAADGAAELHRCPLAAYEDQTFAQEARTATSRTFIAHVRYASTGAVAPENTHPFEQRGRLFAHNGVVEDLDLLDEELGDARSLVHGETDSERVFALITKHIDACGDVTEGLVTALRWIAGRLRVYALNIVLTTPTDVWALRYPDPHQLFILERAAGGPHGDRHLQHASAAGTVRVRSADLARTPAVVVASERMDEDAGWRALQPGELVHVDGQGAVSSQIVLPSPPARPLTVADLEPRAAESQSAVSAPPSSAPP